MVNHNLRSLWEQRLAEREASGKSIATWCKENSVSDRQYYYWRKKLRQNQVENDQAISWLPLGVEPIDYAPGSIAIHIGNATVEIKKGFDKQLLREIALVLQTI